jgi:histidinol-phosphate aminotransferase
MKASDLVRPDIATMEAYTPIYPFEVLASRLGRSPEDIIKLDANENPYGSPPSVREALAQLKYTNVYPDPESRALRRALSDFVGVSADLLLAGAGADELLDLTMRLFLSPGDAIVNCPPTFGMYPFDAAISGGRVITVPRLEGFGLDLDGIAAAVRQHRPKLLFVTCPNNPDGSWVSEASLCRLLDLPTVVVLDEAYVEFAEMENSRIRLVPERENLVVLRTFSKLAGLAGLRIGYGAFPCDVMHHLWKIKQPYNVSVAASAAALAALNDRAWLDSRVDLIVAERRRLSDLLETIPYLEPYPSRANFVLCRVEGRSAEGLKQALEHRGILIRYFDKPGLRDYVRFTVGKPDQTDALIAALREL